MHIIKLILTFLWRGKDQNSQHTIKGEKQSWRTDTTQLTVKLQ